MTLFEKIIAGDIKADLEYEDDKCIAIHDINPQAPTHIVIIPKKLIPRVMNAEAVDVNILGHLLLVSQKIAAKLNINTFEKGYRLIINNGKDAGEEVPHLHIHMLAGRKLSWPPG